MTTATDIITERVVKAVETKEKEIVETTKTPAKAQPTEATPQKIEKNKKNHKAQEAIQATAKAPFAVVEAYKNIRVHLISNLAKTGGKSVVVSSPFASDGKSTTTINLAVTLSQLGKKVVLLDADSRRGTIHKKMKLTNEFGLMDILNGTKSFEEVIINHNKHLDIITYGSNANNPSELLSSDAFSDLLAKLEGNYDYVIIDTPPFNVVSDALVISQKCAGLVLVARSGITAYAAFSKALDTAKSLNINIIGTVINGIGAADNKYGKYGKYGKYSKYYYKYGYSKYDHNNNYSQKN